MIDYINIQNFKSLKDVTFHLKDVNLLIGANNSGKTNFLKAFEFLSNLSNYNFDNENFERNFFDFDGKNEMEFTFTINEKNENPIFFKLLLKFENKKISFIECIGRLKNDSDIDKINLRDFDSIIGELKSFDYHCNNVYDLKIKKYSNSNLSAIVEDIYKQGYIYFTFHGNSTDDYYFKKHQTSNVFPTRIFQIQSDIVSDNFAHKIFLSYFNNCLIYKPNISTLTIPSEIAKDIEVKFDASNLVSFFDEISNNYEDIHDKINIELKHCLGDIVRVSTPTAEIKGKNGVIGKKLRFTDKNKKMYWADEVSDGVLYFLALLAIVYQPNPPKILILEEPEIGIHPNRIREVIDYIFEIAEEKQIQVIITTHSPFLVEQFKDLPENIFVFNKTENITSVKNLQFDIIEPEDLIRKKKGLPPTEHLNNISSHWTVGLLGGVPNYESI
ncbi:MAG: hypothetical protein EAZ53_12015 [Bacteroidetes bacterium]|nr:MAG: hypothetical protein EAZ53_12015 [Bacteroidota bacterium]